MKVLVTCGPGYEPVDEVRRITNFSTGRLGIVLANILSARGWEVLCLKGELATSPELVSRAEVLPFSTNENLAAQLRGLGESGQIGAIFHAAALCDFRVERVEDESGRVAASAKFPTRSGRLKLTLVPALKVLPLLRDWFPQARIVGWKYELEGTREEAFAKARCQIQECRTDGCVLNGRACGEGFAFCDPAGGVREYADVEALSDGLANWLESVPRKLPVG